MTMKGLLLTATMLLAPMALATAADSLDPVEANPDHYKTLFKNDRVRVLEFRDGPGDAIRVHSHPDHVVYVLGPTKRRFTVEGEAPVDAALEAGLVLYVNAQTHTGENIGDTPAHAILVELK